MTDRELLERAARAAGIYGTWSERGQCILITSPGMSWEHWRPLEDDGDALRLAVDMRILVEPGDGMVFAIAPNQSSYSCEVVNECHRAATRRAITRAAAAMGEQE